MKFFALILALAGALNAAPVTGSSADALFAKGDYQQALGHYSGAAGGAGEAGLKAAYRAAECEALLFRYGEAAQRLSAVKLPQTGLWRARFLLLRAETGREFLKQYRYSLPADLQQGTTDLTRLTAGQWEARIAADYDSLWELRRELLGRKLSEEGYFIDIAKARLDYTPTLWDFAAGRWTSYLGEEAAAAGAGVPAQSLAAEDYKADYSPLLGPGAKAAAILEESALMPAAGREAAAGLERIKRLLLPRANSGLFTGYDEARYSAAALAVLRKWAGSLPAALARAQAGFEAASIANALSDYKLAVDLCAAVTKAAPGSRPAARCGILSADIKAPVLNVNSRPAPPPGKGLIDITARNLPELYFRLYPAKPEDLEALRSGVEKDFGYLRYLGEPAARDFLGRKPAQSWQTPLAYQAPYQLLSRPVLPPPLKKGLYVLMVSGDAAFTPGSSIMRAAVVNVTDVFLLGTSGIAGDPESLLYTGYGPVSTRMERPSIFHFYAVDALTGLPLADAALDVFHGRGYSGDMKREKLNADGEGRADIGEDIKVTFGSHQYFQADPLLSSRGAYSLWAYAQGAGFQAPDPVELRLETDRPVYRPGQKVSFKVTALVRVPGGYRVYEGLSRLKVKARDANWQELFSREFPVGPMGSAAGSFEIPAGRLLGQYQVSATLREYEHDFSGESSFRVEEYKRPEFEVKLGEAARAFRYGRPAKVEGTVKYYFGSPVPGAEVKYRVVRSRFVPWYVWWWRWFYAPSGESDFVSGTARTGDDGKFSIEFTPEPEGEAYSAYPASFRVEAEARDAGGRTITDSRSYNAGAKAYNFDITADAGFFTAGQKAGFQARLINLSEAQCAGAGSYEVLRLDKAPDLPEPPEWGGQFGASPSLEQAFAKVEDGPAVERGQLVFSADKATAVALKPLPEGVYRLRLKAEDPWGGSSESAVILVSADPAAKTSKLALPAVTLFEHASYQPGETVRALVGAAALKGVKYVEVMGGDFMLARLTVEGGGVSLVSFKAEPVHRGGFALRWLGAGGFRIYSAMASAAVPRSDRKISLTLAHDQVLKPGQEVNWALKAAGPDGKPVNGEATVRVFDRSLEYYAKGDNDWQAGLYPPRSTNSGGMGPLYGASFMEFPVKNGLVARMMALFDKGLAEEKLPGLRLNSSRVRRFGMLGMAKGNFESNDVMMDAETASLAGAAPAAAGGRAMAKMSVTSSKSLPAGAIRDSSREATAPVVRKDFSETAYFNPQLAVVRGKAPFGFRIPERLTSWKVEASVMTADVKTGNVSAEAVTARELMARLDMPRFFREGDRSEITAVLNSQAPGVLAGEAVLELTLDGRDAAGSFGVVQLARPFELKPGGSVALRWPVEAPRGTAVYKARLIARAGKYADAQENDLPVLPSRERLIASQVAALNGKTTRELRLTELEAADDTRAVESLHLEVQPQLILTVLNSLPFLVHYPYECTEQLLNRYVPLAIVNSFYTKYPELAAAVKKVPHRATITPAWDRDNPARLMTLMETPWETESKGITPPWPGIDMLDPGLVRSEKAASLDKLAGYQNADGSFPWFPGGHGNLYMTLYVLDGLAEAARYGVAVPRDTAQKALRYALNELPRHMKPEQDETSFLLYAAYVVTSFPANWPEQKTGLQYARKWAQYADKQANALTPFGKAYAAYVWLRLGDKKLAESYLDRAMDGAREDAVSGVYWAPEKLSWLWYNDTVEKHAFILRTLLALRPADPRIPGMVKWLLFSRKAGEWKSTKASAAAVYSLLDLMRKNGALEKPEKFAVKWGEVSDKRELKPFDWVGTPLRWSLYGAEADKAPAMARVEKDGPGLAFASLTGIYTTEKQAAESPEGMMNVSRKYFLRVKEGNDYVLKPLASGDSVTVGDQLEVQLTVNTRNSFEFVHLKDPRGAGFEGEGLLSGWKWDLLGRYEEPRDSLTNFFMEWLPHGEYVLKYRVRPTTPGTYRIGAAVLQSMYSPEFAAHSAGMTVKVK